MSQARDALVVTADLAVAVTAPDGRTATVSLGDRDGTLLVDLTQLPALLASLPRTSFVPGVRRLRAVAGAPVLPDLTWQQPVEVTVDGQVVLRRRGGAWRPAGRLLAPVAGAAAGVLGLVVVLSSLLVVVLRRLLRS